MKSASALSMEIRKKKKAMLENRGVVDLSGVEMDKQDEDLMEQDEMTHNIGLDKNTPKMRDQDPSDMELMKADSHNEPPETEAPEPEDESKMKRKARLMKSMGR